MTQEERELYEVHAVSLGAPVTSSSYDKDGNYNVYNSHIVDNNRGPTRAWRSHSNSVGEWIQVYQEYPKLWTAVIIQGGGVTGYFVK